MTTSPGLPDPAEPAEMDLMLASLCQQQAGKRRGEHVIDPAVIEADHS
jgi:hypothetical protein